MFIELLEEGERMCEFRSGVQPCLHPFVFSFSNTWVLIYERTGEPMLQQGEEHFSPFPSAARLQLIFSVFESVLRGGYVQALVFVCMQRHHLCLLQVLNTCAMTTAWLWTSTRLTRWSDGIHTRTWMQTEKVRIGAWCPLFWGGPEPASLIRAAARLGASICSELKAQPGVSGLP